MLTVDPGPEHTGIALWFYYPGKGWRCDHAQEISPGDFVTSLENYLKSNSLGTVVYESWQLYADKAQQQVGSDLDRKSTRLNSSHVAISYAVFCLKKKKNS